MVSMLSCQEGGTADSELTMVKTGKNMEKGMLGRSQVAGHQPFPSFLIPEPRCYDAATYAKPDTTSDVSLQSADSSNLS